MKYKVNCIKTAKKLESQMESHNLKVRDVAEYMDVSETAVYKWKTGQTKPSLDSMANLAMLFNVTVNDIMVLERI